MKIKNMVFEVVFEFNVIFVYNTPKKNDCSKQKREHTHTHDLLAVCSNLSFGSLFFEKNNYVVREHRLPSDFAPHNHCNRRAAASDANLISASNKNHCDGTYGLHWRKHY